MTVQAIRVPLKINVVNMNEKFLEVYKPSLSGAEVIKLMDGKSMMSSISLSLSVDVLFI